MWPYEGKDKVDLLVPPQEGWRVPPDGPVSRTLRFSLGSQVGPRDQLGAQQGCGHDPQSSEQLLFVLVIPHPSSVESFDF